MENQSSLPPNPKPGQLFQALQSYIFWTEQFIELLENIGSLPKKWPKPKKGEVGIPVRKIPVPTEAMDFPLLHANRKDRYDLAYKLADSEKAKTDDSRKPIAERWSTRLRAALLRSAIGINTLIQIPENEIPQTFVVMSYNRKVKTNLRRAVRELNKFLSVLGVLSREGAATKLAGPTEPDIDACLRRLKLNGKEFREGKFFDTEVWHITSESLRQALLAGEIEAEKGPHRNSPNKYQVRSVVRKFWPRFQQ